MIKFEDVGGRLVGEANGFKVTIITKYGVTKRTRAYIDGYEDVDFSDLYSIPNWPNDPSLTPEFKRRNKIIVSNMRKVIAEFASTVVGNPMIAIFDHKWSFSKKAGCSCGCSSGFVLNRVVPFTHDGYIRSIESIHIEKLDK
jgi:hypothetical protein